MRFIRTTANGQPAAALYMHQSRDAACMSRSRLHVMAVTPGRHLPRRGVLDMELVREVRPARLALSAARDQHLCHTVEPKRASSHLRRSAANPRTALRLARRARNMPAVAQELAADPDYLPTELSQIGVSARCRERASRRIGPVLWTVVLDAHFVFPVPHVDATDEAPNWSHTMICVCGRGKSARRPAAVASGSPAATPRRRPSSRPPAVIALCLGHRGGDRPVRSTVRRAAIVSRWPARRARSTRGSQTCHGGRGRTPCGRESLRRSVDQADLVVGELVAVDHDALDWHRPMRISSAGSSAPIHFEP